MRLTNRSVVLSFLFLCLTASVSAASTTLFKNYCPESLYLTINNGETFPLPSGAAFTTNIVGRGNTALVAKSVDAFNAETPKLVFGTSSDLEVLYWSLSAQNGDPFGPMGEHFNVTTGGQDATGLTVPNLCQNATSYDGLVHACQDSGKVILTVFGCPFNAAV